MKTYYIKKEDCKDVGWAYEIEGATYDGNLIIDVGKTIVINGDQKVKGDQLVKGEQRVEDYQVVEGYQIVEGDQVVRRKVIIGHCKWVIFYSKETIKIGCETKTAPEWEDWFASDKVFETPRDSLAFNQIYKAFKMAEIAQELDDGLA